MAASVSRASRAPRSVVAGSRPRATVPHARTGPPPLVEFAIRQFARHHAVPQPDRLRGPLVLVASQPELVRHALANAAAAGRDDATEARTGGLAVWDGRTLGDTIGVALRSDDLGTLRTRLAATPRCLVEWIDRVGRPDIQDAFVQLFDAAVGAGTAFCLTLTKHPSICGLEPHLTSRLCGGLLVRMPVHEGAPGAGRTPISLRRLLGVVARHHDLTTADLVGPSRCRATAEARSVAMYLARQLTDRSLYAIGRACGGRDHTTVLHGVRVIERRIGGDPAFAADIALLASSMRPTADPTPRPVGGLSVRVRLEAEGPDDISPDA